MLERIESVGSYDGTVDVGHDVNCDRTVAGDITAARIALPARGAACDPASELLDAQSRIFTNLRKHIVVPEEEWPSPLPAACHRVEGLEESALIRRILECDMGELIPESDVEMDAAVALEEKADFET